MHALNAAWAWALARSDLRAVRWVRHGSPAGHARRRQAERGQTLAEYSLLLALISVTAIVALAALGSTTNGLIWDPINRVFGEVMAMISGS